MRSALLIDSGVDTVTDLAALLPAEVRDRIVPEMLTEFPTAAALRVLATIRDPRWHQFVGAARIDWDGLLTWGREYGSASVRVRVEAAASLDGWAAARVNLARTVAQLDRSNLLAVMDGIRIAAEGVSA
jgi:hypothetical protein